MKTLILVMTMAFASSSFAFVRVGVDKIKSAKTIQAQAKKEGLGIPRTERTLKIEIVKQKKKDKKAFEAKLADGLSNTAEYQSYLLEVRDGLDKIEQAKVIAKYTLLNQIRQNKDFMHKSIINRHAAVSWDETEYYLKRDINESLVYIPTKTTKDLQFEAADWGRVTVASNLSTAKWHVDIASRFDANKPEPTAKDIKIDGEGGGFEPGMDEEMPISEQPQAPILTQIDNKTALEKAVLKPKIRK